MSVPNIFDLEAGLAGCAEVDRILDTREDTLLAELSALGRVLPKLGDPDVETEVLHHRLLVEDALRELAGERAVNRRAEQRAYRRIQAALRD